MQVKGIALYVAFFLCSYRELPKQDLAWEEGDDDEEEEEEEEELMRVSKLSKRRSTEGNSVVRMEVPLLDQHGSIAQISFESESFPIYNSIGS